MGAPAFSRRPLPAAPSLSSLVLPLLLLVVGEMVTGKALTSHSAALARKLSTQQYPPQGMHKQYYGPTFCQVNPPLMLSPTANCYFVGLLTTTASECYQQCINGWLCSLYAFYSKPLSAEVNCILFADYDMGQGLELHCDWSALVPPAPEWGTVVYGTADGGDCGAGISSVSGDPHFVGASGTRFDFNGELGATYCLVSDKKVHINALLAGYKTSSVVGASVAPSGKGVRSWMRELGVIWSDGNGRQHTLRLVARSGRSNERGAGFLAAAELDGVPLSVPKAAGVVLESQLLKFTFVGNSTSKASEKDLYRLSIPSRVDMTFELQTPSLLYQLPNEAFVHFNVMLNKLEASSAIHGILGQTYRRTSAQMLKAVKYNLLSTLMGEPIKADGPSGFGFLDGTPGDYVATGVLKPDCAFSSYSN